jgi:diguanylate cyclase (GGDEF)-like protein
MSLPATLPLDDSTLLFVNAVVCVTSGILYGLDVRRQPHTAALWWGLTFVFGSMPGFIYVAAHELGQPWLYPVGNGVVVLAVAFIWKGARAFNQRPAPAAAWLTGPILVVAIPLLWERSFHEWSGGLVYLAGVALYCLMAAREFLSPKGIRLQNHVVLGAAVGIAGLFYTMRAAAFVMLGPYDPVFEAMFGPQIATLVSLLLIMVCSFSLVALGKEMGEAALRHAATIDGLTQVMNRAAFIRAADAQLRTLAATRAPATALIFDLDHFKAINDTFGHAAGDEVLVRCAETVAKCLEANDLFCRYGGEEFAVLLPGVGAEKAGRIAARMLAIIRAIAVQTERGLVRPTASIGLASALPGETDLSALISRADEALYTAKQAGRNRVEGHRAAA